MLREPSVGVEVKIYLDLVALGGGELLRLIEIDVTKFGLPTPRSQMPYLRIVANQEDSVASHIGGGTSGTGHHSPNHGFSGSSAA
jgi:hypothetical protein